MSFAKKFYTKPELTTHGNVETLTQQGGGNSIDVPFGTPVTPDTTINDVTS
jgi:hypothetical protein